MAQAITEAEKSHDLPFATLRTRKSSGAIQLESKGPRIGVADDVSPNLTLNAGEQKTPMVKVRRKWMPQL